MASKKLKSNFKTLFRTGSLEETTNSASLAEAERRIKFLEKENQELREEIVDVKAMYIQLTRESSQEKYDERRVNFLKAQMIQLERQILLLNEALGGRMAVLLEAENALQTIVECCRQYEKQGDRIGETHISKEDLNVIVQTAESAKIKLYKNIENTTMLRLHKPLKFMEKFIKQSHMEQSTLLDVCSGEIEHLNLKQVAKLESQLSQIYTQLLCVNQCLAVQVFPESFQTSEPHSQIGPQVPKANFIKLFGESSKACNLLSDVLPDLLELSVLVPAAPWPMLKKRLVKELSVDNVMARLPTFSRSKTTEVRDTVESLLKVISLLQLKNTVQEKTYREEIKYHKTVYQLQLEYIDHLFKSLRCGYSEFEKDASALICRPLSEVLRIYDTLKITASEEALRQFLKLFKQYEPQIAAAVAKLEVKESDPEVFSNFGEEFFEKLYLLEIDCQRERDENIERLQDVKERQEEYWQEIKTLFHNDASRDNRHESDTSRTESTTGRNSRSLSVLPSPHHEMEQPYNDKKESHSQLSSRSELTQEEPVPDSSTHESRNNVVLLPLIDKQRQTNKARRSSPLSRRPRSSSASRKNIHDKERRWESEQITTAHGESEELFKASLRADYDGGKGFDFTLDSEREDSSSNCTCGAEHSTEEHLVRAESTGMIHRDKPPSGRRDSPLRRNNRNNMSTSGNSSISSGKAIRPVPKTRLVLKPRVKRDMSAPASDSESDTSYYDNRNSKVESKTAESDIRRSSDVGLEGNNIEASFPYKTGGVKRSGSLPRSLMKTKQNSTSSPWK